MKNLTLVWLSDKNKLIRPDSSDTITSAGNWEDAQIVINETGNADLVIGFTGK
jgi:hypothetical protein